jgi:hypothetical protein
MINPLAVIVSTAVGPGGKGKNTGAKKPPPNPMRIPTINPITPNCLPFTFVSPPYVLLVEVNVNRSLTLPPFLSRGVFTGTLVKWWSVIRLEIIIAIAGVVCT